MTDFFNDQKQKVVSGINLLTINDYRDIHLATLQVLEKTGVFVEEAGNYATRRKCSCCDHQSG